MIGPADVIDLWEETKEFDGDGVPSGRQRPPGSLRPAVSPVWLSPLLAALLAILASSPVEAQFGDLKKKALQGVLCGGGVVAGFKIGDAIAKAEAVRKGIPAKDFEKYRRGFQIGSALILCKGGAAIAGSVYDKLSKKDLEARQREMEAAVADAEPGTHTYVLPESQIKGTITTETPVTEGNEECRTVVDQLADVEGGEPVMTKFCRKLPNGKYEVKAF
jgi:hypothetical protein